MPKCLNALYVRQLEIEVTISDTSIFVKFGGVLGWFFVCFLGFFLWQTFKMYQCEKNTLFLNASSSHALEAFISVAYSC